MQGKRRRFTAEFKEEAVRLLSRSGRPLAQVARELGIHENLLRKWRAVVNGSSDSGGGSRHFTLAEENRRLQLELARVKEERDIFKKATAFFAKESR